ncbi:MAG TPA: Rrf2 family transcriptional regulator [Candidatus Butyricicoccus avistercoris]|uniref:Rrf2 family transcriptional regulator n=1 Tax=Candidatus Butyricicoccus avistercoris TaxID=2838518 RepID=A0A9D1PGJ4_9FIRM|nr:Rrf2 family transcriptional regulator [Candidatus Butyricicoccus avistercoris]
MRITHEADYAIRVAHCLACSNDKISAKQISESTGVTLRFALKILRKLIQADIVKSFKGVSGGYMLNRSPADISFGEIIEAIDGRIAINHCLTGEFECTRVAQKKQCDFRKVFVAVNQQLRDELYSITLDRFIS